MLSYKKKHVFIGKTSFLFIVSKWDPYQPADTKPRNILWPDEDNTSSLNSPHSLRMSLIKE